MSGLRRLIVEVHRRSLWQVLLIYLAASWGVIEAADHVIERFDMPEWVYGGVVLLLLVGLPIVLATAFVQEGIGKGPAPEPGQGAREAVGDATPPPPSLLNWRYAISGGVLAFALWGVVATTWLILGRDRVPAGDAAMPSVAVLPFTTAAVQAEDADFFADGLHDELLTQLSKVSGLAVISRSSVMQYAVERPTIPEIGSALGVGAVVEGGVQRTTDRIRVNVQLIDAATDEHIWAETYDRSLTLDNLFDIQAEIAQRVASELRGELTPAEQSEMARRSTESLEAYELYIQGRNHYNRRFRPDENLRALELFAEAGRIDPDFTEAHAFEALAHIWTYWFSFSPESAEPARAALDRAIASGPQVSETLLARGMYRYRIDGDYGSALELLQGALQDTPGNAELIQAVAGVQRRLGRWDAAVASLERSFALNPAAADDALIIGQTFRLMRRPTEALRYLERAISLDPNHDRARAERSWALIGLRQDTAAAQAALAQLTDEERIRVRTRRIQHAPIADPAYYRRDWDATIDAQTQAGGPISLGLALWAAGRREEAAMVGDSVRYYNELRIEEGGQTTLGAAAVHVFAGLGYALAGDTDEARAHGDRATAMLTSDQDAFYGPRVEWTRMLISILIGDTDDALDRLEFLVSVPSEAQHGFLRLDPIFDGLRGDPRFEELVQRAEAAAG